MPLHLKKTHYDPAARLQRTRCIAQVAKRFLLQQVGNDILRDLRRLAEKDEKIKTLLTQSGYNMNAAPAAVMHAP